MVSVVLEELACGCTSWIQGAAVHIKSCRARGHYDLLVAAAQSSGLPIEVQA